MAAPPPVGWELKAGMLGAWGAPRGFPVRYRWTTLTADRPRLRLSLTAALLPCSELLLLSCDTADAGHGDRSLTTPIHPLGSRFEKSG
jgi:hypothetical protein